MLLKTRKDGFKFLSGFRGILGGDMRLKYSEALGAGLRRSGLVFFPNKKSGTELF